MEKPVEPNKEDCCNSGCNPCIFDIYEKQLALYQKYLENGDSVISTFHENGVSQLEYTSFVVVKNVELCDSHYLIILQREKPNGIKVWWKPGHHLLLKFTDPEGSCTRAYTPVMVKGYSIEQKNYDFSIVVKKYEEGLVSQFLCNLEVGCTTLWRGPYGHYEICPNKFDRIIMIAQGTGIAPFVSIIDNILNNEDDMTKIQLFYCCKSIDTIIFRNELHSYKGFWNFRYEIYVTSILSDAKLKYQEPIVSKKFQIEDLLKLNPFGSKDQILICGSEKFMQSYNVSLKNEIPLIENIILF
ncbi:NADH-cytochrome b5 reductase-like [Anticarsia gemmatalis]|uniref:NADH-cytochrome b5 reductase-like n=1 Tax=Anticarsia gemmatalis TaxID=129554 RepID=UPI003F7722AC